MMSATSQTSLAALARMGAPDVYVKGHKLDYDAFMSSTESAQGQEPIAKQRDAVCEAFDRLRASRDVIGIVEDPGFVEASREFDKVLADAVAACKAAGVDAQTGTAQFFKLAYTRR